MGDRLSDGMWRLLSRSVAGVSHGRREDLCEDCCRATPYRVGEESILILACADGAGSAKYAQAGARRACQAIVQRIERHFEAAGRVVPIDRTIALEWYIGVATELVSEAATKRAEARDFACTLLTAVVADHWSAFMQVGDGAIVTVAPDGYNTVFWPQNGEYVNETNFITGGGLEEELAFRLDRKAVDAVAMLTDGLQRLALDFRTQRVHAPFFEPLFRALREMPTSDELEAPLRTFLDSARVNERTDDDKTLVLALRVVDPA